jgi:hypothetical protein
MRRLITLAENARPLRHPPCHFQSHLKRILKIGQSSIHTEKSDGVAVGPWAVRKMVRKNV